MQAKPLIYPNISNFPVTVFNYSVKFIKYTQKETATKKNENGLHGRPKKAAFS